MTLFRCASIVLPQVLILLFWAGSHDLLGGWNQTDDAMLTLLVLFLLTPVMTLALLVTETVRSSKREQTGKHSALWIGLAGVLFIEALVIDFYLLTQVRM